MSSSDCCAISHKHHTFYMSSSDDSTVLLAIQTLLFTWARQMTPVQTGDCSLQCKEFICALVHEMSTGSWTTSLQCSLRLGVTNYVCVNMSVTWLDALHFLFCAKTLLAIYQFFLYLSSVCHSVLVSWTACGQTLSLLLFYFPRACFISLVCGNPPHWIWCIDIQFVLTTAVFISPAQLTLYRPDVTILVDWV